MTLKVKKAINYFSDLKDHCTLCYIHTTQDQDHKRTFKDMRDLGYRFQEYKHKKTTNTNHPAFCGVCKKKTSHRRLISTISRQTTGLRQTSIEGKIRERVYKIYKGVEAFTDRPRANGKDTLQIDHRIPESRRQHTGNCLVELDPITVTDEELKNTYMLLTAENNYRKREECNKCIRTGKRPAALCGVLFWFKGTRDYDSTIGCDGCFWAYPKAWREGINKCIKVQE